MSTDRMSANLSVASKTERSKQWRSYYMFLSKK
nr:MAG TPA: hypothetical protein [Caudoviricetes sp.]